MSNVFSMIAKGLGARPGTEELAFTARSPKEYAMMLLEQAGITNLEKLNKTFVGDPGFDIVVRQRSFGRGIEFDSEGVKSEAAQKSQWFLFERMPGESGQDYLRGRLFNSFEGAAAEFAIKLRLHPVGDVKITESTAAPGAWQLSFSGQGRQMVMAPVEVGLEAAAATR